MNQLQSEITQLESNPAKNQTELDSKKKQLAELETKEKELTKSLPLTTQISILQKEIQTLTNKPTKTKAEERVLESKKQELAELLRKQNDSNTNNAKPSDKTKLYIGLGIVGVVLLISLFIFIRKHKKRPT
ncbi:7137_t:CDS:1 [Ambispora gerdemannii]|uniref:7137_t:CDS:1 n=1 Tax=Ambispora gerdemannii TaxID=144530 RepID=A0A9N9F5J4_9GLOM|nr:7137_t:CDS:1 [Ambispora gerdemannii]